jgi:glycosyltransferase involved in cell wall biosynthesis
MDKLLFVTPVNNDCGPGFMAVSLYKTLSTQFSVVIGCTSTSEYECAVSNNIKAIRIFCLDSCIRASCEFNHILFAVGNNQDHHGKINSYALLIPGVVMLHDFVYHHFFISSSQELHQGRLQGYLNLVSLMYGWGANRLKQTIDNTMLNSHEKVGFWDSAEVSEWPLYEPFLATSERVICHSEFHEADIIGKSLSAFNRHSPAIRLRNPCDLKELLPTQEIQRYWADVCRRTSKDVIFASFGHNGPSKCLEITIEAFGMLAASGFTFEYRIYGGISKKLKQRLLALSKIFSVEARIKFLGRISDDELLEAQQQTDIFINIRQPNTEGQSGSVIEQLATGRPVVCYNSGCYLDIPESACIKISGRLSPVAIFSALKTLVDLPRSKWQEIGQMGILYAERYSCASYAKILSSSINDEDIARSGSDAITLRLANLSKGCSLALISLSLYAKSDVSEQLKRIVSSVGLDALGLVQTAGPMFLVNSIGNLDFIHTGQDLEKQISLQAKEIWPLAFSPSLWMLLAIEIEDDEVLCIIILRLIGISRASLYPSYLKLREAMSTEGRDKALVFILELSSSNFVSDPEALNAMRRCLISILQKTSLAPVFAKN